MNEILRNTQLLTAETLLLFTGLLCITLAKVFDEQRFQSFLSIIFNYRYLKLYSKEKNQTQHWFNIVLFIPQLIIFSLIIREAAIYFNLAPGSNIYVIICFLFLFILFKYYVEKIISTIFEITEFTESFQFHKLTYRNYSAMILLPFVAYYIFSGLPQDILIIVITGLFILLNIMCLALTLINHQNSIARHLFYFILYLCALEIAPYLILTNLLILDKA
ncbi:DUF4271 domain-containing protein [Robertkochia marina]|uniref:DUF4271 domain-containing protein n=1 Tax=Robertkochia marina TaxID=1227945 RepID=A0A4S3M1U6_9FLAO|nr:DUF4271 domain-containing protein [Robertkochia marina]THD69084.1 DUF4271 domain-containing protein [Robertkochia marina]TRZ44935.1 DUF4271 domain-containing protein [Robertkochia marina]